VNYEPNLSETLQPLSLSQVTRELEHLRRHIEEWGIVAVSSAYVVHDPSAFALGEKEALEKASQYIQEDRANIQGSVTEETSTYTGAGAGVGVGTKTSSSAGQINVNALLKFLRDYQETAVTRSPITVTNSYTSGTTFGFRIAPSFTALSNPAARRSGTANRLIATSFPALVILGSRDDARPAGRHIVVVGASLSSNFWDPA
jgi:hypothetical protein